MAPGVPGPVYAAVSRSPQAVGKTKVALSPARRDGAHHVSMDGTAQEGHMLSAEVAEAAPFVYRSGWRHRESAIPSGRLIGNRGYRRAWSLRREQVVRAGRGTIFNHSFPAKLLWAPILKAALDENSDRSCARVWRIEFPLPYCSGCASRSIIEAKTCIAKEFLEACP